jgi:DNA-dependent RNA polymerase auxiliary subunit epsilon
MIHYVPYFENEILENLLILSSDKKDDYINYVIDTIQKTKFSDYDEEVIAVWLKKYKSSVDEFPDFINDDLSHWLKRYYNGYADHPKDYDFILDIQSDFYYYAAGLEAQKMISFLESKKSAAINNTSAQTETAEKIKWIGKPSQLGFIIGKLVEFGYIDTPKRINGDTNFTQFAKQVKNTFDVETTESTLSKYLNLESEKGQETERKFKENGFNIPHIKGIS